MGFADVWPPCSVCGTSCQPCSAGCCAVCHKSGCFTKRFCTTCRGEGTAIMETKTTMRCFCCAKEIVELSPEDRSALEKRLEKEDYDYKYAPCYVIEVIAEASGQPCRCAIICWSCIRRIEPDMWESDKTWATYNPAVAFNELPIFDHENERREDPELYRDHQPPDPGLHK